MLKIKPLLLFAVGGLITCICVAGNAVSTYWNALETSRWTPTSGVILSTSISVVSHSKGNCYVANVKYEYFIGIDGLQGSSVRFRDECLLGNEREHVTRNFPVGQKIPVYVDPSNKHSSVLETSSVWYGTWTQFFLAIIFSIPCLIVGSKEYRRW